MLVPARSQLLVLLVSLVLALFVLPFLLLLLLGLPGRWAMLVAFVAFDVFLIGGLVLLARRYPVDPAIIFGSWPRTSDLLKACALVIPTGILGMGADFALYFPLSFVAPDFVEGWYLDSGIELISEGGSLLIGANAVLLTSLVLLGPFAEELFFRGFLLRRLARKWSLGAAIIVSSIIFAVLHANLFDAFFSGIVVSLLYVRSRSLWIPIAMHGLHNFIVMVLSIATSGAETVAEFQASWPWSLTALVLGGAWFVYFVRRWWPRPGQTLPSEW